MKRLALFSGVYLVVSVAIAFAVRDDMWIKLQSVAKKSGNFASVLGESFYLFAAAFFLIFALHGVAEVKRRAAAIGWAVLALLLFQPAFTLFKTTMPALMPFWADPMLAELDRALHFGIDPWVLAHQIDAVIPMMSVVELYLTAWIFPAFFLPMLLAATDTDTARVNRTLIIYVFAWVGIGNVIALGGLSVGPVYYDLLLGTERFSEMLAMLETKGITASYLGETQALLWQLYVDGDQALGSGISAFPSVHVSVATVLVLYLWDRNRWLAVPGAVFWIAVMILSVYTGYHYALDGYVSAGLVWGLWYALKKRAQRSVVFQPATV